MDLDLHMSWSCLSRVLHWQINTARNWTAPQQPWDLYVDIYMWVDEVPHKKRPLKCFNLGIRPFRYRLARRFKFGYSSCRETSRDACAKFPTKSRYLQEWGLLNFDSFFKVLGRLVTSLYMRMWPTWYYMRMSIYRLVRLSSNPCTTQVPCPLS